MWSSEPASQGQSPLSKGCREHVMILQPASENSFTVAWPMPREAPVSTMVFCSADGRSIREGALGNGQSTVFSKADPLFRITGRVGAHIDSHGCVARVRNVQMSDPELRVCTIRAKRPKSIFCRGSRPIG